MVHEDLVFQMLTRVGEVDAEQFNPAPITGQVGNGVHADDRAAQGHHHMLECCVFAEPGEVGRKVLGVSVPVLHAHHGQLCAIANDHLQVFAEDRCTGILDHNDTVALRFRLNQGVRCSWHVPERVAGDGGLGCTIAGDCHHHGRLETGPGVCGAAFLGFSAGANPVVAAISPLDGGSVSQCGGELVLAAVELSSQE